MGWSVALRQLQFLPQHKCIYDCARHNPAATFGPPFLFFSLPSSSSQRSLTQHLQADLGEWFLDMYLARERRLPSRYMIDTHPPPCQTICSLPPIFTVIQWWLVRMWQRSVWRELLTPKSFPRVFGEFLFHFINPISKSFKHTPI